MTVIRRASSAAVLAAVLTLGAVVATLLLSWVSGWSISLTGVLAVARASSEAVDGIYFDPNAPGLLVVTGALATLLAAASQPRPVKVKATD